MQQIINFLNRKIIKAIKLRFNYYILCFGLKYAKPLFPSEPSGDFNNKNSEITKKNRSVVITNNKKSLNITSLINYQYFILSKSRQKFFS